MKLSCEQIKEIREYEKRRGISYAATDGKLFKHLLLFGFIAWLYAIIMVAFYILGTLIIANENTALWNNTFITILTAAVISLTTPVLFGLGLKLTSLLINIVTVIILGVSFIRISCVDDETSAPGSVITQYDPGFLGLKRIFYWRNGIPMTIVIVLFTWLAVIIIRERYILKKEYNNIQNNKYKPQITE